MLRQLALLPLAFPAVGCAVSMPAIPMRAFVEGDLGSVAVSMQREVAGGYAENQALVLNVLGQCELLEGRIEEAAKHLEVAGAIMGNWQVSGGEEFAAIVGSESSKNWRGDPYEKVMNAFYLGLTFLWRGEPDNARAAFKRGILADAEVGDERYQADCALLFWLAGRMSRLMGTPGDAGDLFAEAQQANRFMIEHGSRGDAANPVLREPASGNLVILAECGMGPEKFATGGNAELARFRPRWHPACRARVHLGEQFLGETSILCDVDYQARTLGGTEMEGIRAGKAVFKNVSTVAGIVLLNSAAHDHGNSAQTKAILGGSLLFLGLLTSTEADVRHWPTLPSTVQVLTADVPEGDHQLRIEFVDESGRVLDDLTQNWRVTVPEGGESYYLFRSLPGLDRIESPKQ
jgi:hypothetical protein